MKRIASLSNAIICLVLLLCFNPGFAQTNFWQQTNGPTDVRSIAVDSNDYIFAVTSDSYGLFRSSDNGQTWTNLGLSAVSMFYLAINVNGYIFVTLYYGFGDAGYSDLYRSSDHGQSWKAVLRVGTWPHGYFTALACGLQGEVYAGTSDRELLRSSDNGVHWSYFNLNNSFVRSIAINSKGHVFAGTDSSLFRFTDAGSNWVEVNIGLTSFPINSIAINSDDEIFVGNRDGIFYSINNGDNWQHTGLAIAGTLAISANGDIFLGTPNNGVYHSSDRGHTWTQRNTGLTTQNVRNFDFNSKGYVFAATQQGVFRSVQPITSVKEL